MNISICCSKYGVFNHPPHLALPLLGYLSQLTLSSLMMVSPNDLRRNFGG